ncbi:MAG TPA: HAD family hydrolase [Candidatus Nitrosocosmicus sp.]|nr:HAD family hydrolase [Candidatus Nitrosocosmicus sp.]
MIKAIIFDLDGVLVVPAYKFSQRLHEDFGISSDITAPFFSGKFQECLIGRADLKEELKPYLIKWKWDKSLDSFLEYWFKSEHNLDEELISYIDNLKDTKFRCYVATNQEKYRTQYILNNMGFREQFERVFSSAMLGYAKPQKEFYESIMSRLEEIKEKEILFWDDTQSHVEAAVEFGWNAELYTSFDGFKKIMKSKYHII